MPPAHANENAHKKAKGSPMGGGKMCAPGQLKKWCCCCFGKGNNGNGPK